MNEEVFLAMKAHNRLSPLAYGVKGGSRSHGVKSSAQHPSILSHEFGGIFR